MRSWGTRAPSYWSPIESKRTRPRARRSCGFYERKSTRRGFTFEGGMGRERRLGAWRVTFMAEFHPHPALPPSRGGGGGGGGGGAGGRSPGGAPPPPPPPPRGGGGGRPPPRGGGEGRVGVAL